MPELKIFEAPRNGPMLEPHLLRLDVDLGHLKQSGANLQRFNLRDHGEAFRAHPQVLAEKESLPIILVDERIVSRGIYPSREQLATWAGVTLLPSGGCGGMGCTCGG